MTTRRCRVGLSTRNTAFSVVALLMLGAGMISIPPADAATFTVVSTGDSGGGTLRQALVDAEGVAGTDTIAFNVPGTGPHTIRPASALPLITDPVVIDGYTQPGSSPATQYTQATLMIELDGSQAGTSADGLVIHAGSSTVRGLAINRFDGNGINLQSNGNNLIEGNYIGTDVGGTVDEGNERHGVYVLLVPDNTIGGTSVAARNIISGNDSSGIQLVGHTASGNYVQGNYVGTDACGTAALANGHNGIDIQGAHNCAIGGTDSGARNVISRNGRHAIQIQGNGATENIVQGNYIGTGAQGISKLGNVLDGINIAEGSNNTVGGTTSGAPNVISDNGRNGVRISGNSAAGNIIQGNYIGTDFSGTADLGNGDSGVLIYEAPNNTVGGLVANAGNLISANDADGVYIGYGNATGNVVAGNYIGTDYTGTVDLGNGSDGFCIRNGGSCIVGGTAVHARNIISGNGHSGVNIDCGSANLIEGNYIGTDLTGTQSLGNGWDGVFIYGPNNVIGGAVPGARNVISANSGNGVHFHESHSNGNILQGNHIGTDISGTCPLGNGDRGVAMGYFAHDNTIGGVGDGESNVIAHNGAEGVSFSMGTGNAILSNAIFCNGALGIDLGRDGVTPNDVGDGDAGANWLQNFPVLTSARRIGGTTIVEGTFNSGASTTFRLEFFSNSTPDTSNHGEGESFLGTISVNTDAAGDASFSATFPVGVPLGYYVSATATDPASNSSEFSEVVKVVDVFTVTTTDDTTPPNPGSLRYALEQGNTYAGRDTITFDIPGAIPHTIRLASALPAVSDPVVIDGYTQPGASPATASVPAALMIELDGSQAGSGVDGLVIEAGNSTVRGLVINRFDGSGISLEATGGNVVEGNYIGTGVHGVTDAGNGSHGVCVSSTDGNLIGGTTPATSNVVCGNDSSGIWIGGDGARDNVVQGNYIGTDPSGTLGIRNSHHGVRIGSSASDNTIGGWEPEQANTIVWSGSAGVCVGGGTGNAVLSNSISDNTGLGIDLGDDGVTPNDTGDGDTGTNNLQNFPMLASAIVSGGSTIVEGSLSSSAGTEYDLQFFSSAEADPSGYGEGELHLGDVTVTTDANGQGDFVATLPAAAGQGHWVSATATDPGGNTSEFSQSVSVTLGAHPTVVVERLALRLEQAFPNPFREMTTILLNLDRERRAAVRVYNVDHQLVCTLADDVMPAGPHTLNWSGRSDDGVPLSSGLYVCSLEVDDRKLSHRVILLE